jgi:hypothetical protein
MLFTIVTIQPWPYPERVPDTGASILLLGIAIAMLYGVMGRLMRRQPNH